MKALWFAFVIGTIVMAIFAWRADAATYSYTGGTSVTGTDPGWCYAQSFTASATENLTHASFIAGEVSSATGTLRAELYSATSGQPSGSVLATSENTYDASTLRDYNSTQLATPLLFTFDGTYELQSGTEYAIAYRYVSGTGEVRIAQDTSSGVAGNVSYSNGCSTWTEIESNDLVFQVISAAAGGGGNTTTTVTSTTSMIVQNPTQDMFNGIVLSLTMIVLVVLFLELRRKKLKY